MKSIFKKFRKKPKPNSNQYAAYSIGTLTESHSSETHPLTVRKPLHASTKEQHRQEQSQRLCASQLAILAAEEEKEKLKSSRKPGRSITREQSYRDRASRSNSKGRVRRFRSRSRDKSGGGGLFGRRKSEPSINTAHLAAAAAAVSGIDLPQHHAATSFKLKRRGSGHKKEEVQPSWVVKPKPLRRGRAPPKPRLTVDTQLANRTRRRVAANNNNSNNKRMASSTTTAATSTSMGSTTNTPTKKPLKTPEEQRALNREAERVARAAAALDHRGNELFERGFFDKAMEAYSKALKLKRRTFHSMLEEADGLLDEQVGPEDQKLENEELDPKLLVSMATSINNIGYLRQRSGDATPDETMTAYKKSLCIKRKILGNDSLSVGKTLNNIGSVHYLKKEFDEAIPAYEEASQIMTANLGEGHPDVATVSSNIGDVLVAKGQDDESLLRYRHALNIRWEAFGEKDPRVRRLLEKIARIEIGDKMMTPRAVEDGQVFDWDENELYDLDMRPLHLEFQTLRTQVEQDLERVDLMQKKMAVDMVKDKVNILRGMRKIESAVKGQDDESSRIDDDSFVGGNSHRDLLHGSHRSGSHRDLLHGSHRSGSHRDLLHGSHSSSIHMSPVAVPGHHTNADRGHAHRHIKERLEMLRRKRGVVATPGEKTTTNPSLSTSVSSLGTGAATNIFGPDMYQQTHRPALSSLNPEEVKGKVDNLKSALKLREGIDSLRSFSTDQEHAPRDVKAGSMIGMVGS